MLRRLLHGFRESPGIAPGSHGARMAPQRRAFPRRCTGYSFVTSIIYAPKVNVNDRAGQIARLLIHLIIKNAIFNEYYLDMIKL